jgi:hypothetical protein
MTTDSILTVEPDVTREPCGWLAVTPMTCRYRIAAIGPTEEIARERFARSLALWADAAQRSVLAVVEG